MYPYISILGREIPTYGIFMILGLTVAYVIAQRRAAVMGLWQDGLLTITAVAFGFALAGAKILYILVSMPFSQVWSQISAGDFSPLSGGGLVFYGGLIGGIPGAILGAKIAGVKLSEYETVIVPCIPIGHAFGRLGCLMAGCCYGIPYEGIFSIHYPRSITGLSPELSVFPVQLLEAILNIIICLAMMAFAKKSRKKYELLLLYLLLYAVERFFLEFLRGDRVRGIYAGFSLSQWISLGLTLLIVVFYTISTLERTGNKPTPSK